MRALCPQVKEPAPVLDFGCRGRDRPLSLPLLGRSETEWGETPSPNAPATGEPQAPAPALSGRELTGALSCVWVRSSPRVSNSRWAAFQRRSLRFTCPDGATLPRRSCGRASRRSGRPAGGSRARPALPRLPRATAGADPVSLGEDGANVLRPAVGCPLLWLIYRPNSSAAPSLQRLPRGDRAPDYAFQVPREGTPLQSSRCSSSARRSPDGTTGCASI